MNTQDAFDQIYAHFHRPGARLGIGLGGAQYRVGYKPDGRRCAVGLLIPDDLYDPEMDRGYAGVNQNKLVKRVLRKIGFRSSKVFDFLGDAQLAHDEAENIREFRTVLDDLAAEYGLKVDGVKVSQDLLEDEM